jgi:hypothetical protein
MPPKPVADALQRIRSHKAHMSPYQDFTIFAALGDKTRKLEYSQEYQKDLWMVVNHCMNENPGRTEEIAAFGRGDSISMESTKQLNSLYSVNLLDEAGLVSDVILGEFREQSDANQITLES